MKFRHYLETITGVDIYPLISLVIFFAFFTGLFIWAVRVSKSYIDEVKNLPLSNNND